MLLNKYVLEGELKSLFSKVKIQNDSWLKNKVSVEPGESLWDAITKAAMVTGQHVWLDPDGTIQVGDPFAVPYQVKQALKLYRSGSENNVLDASYDEDISNIYSDIRLLSQDSKAQHIISSVKIDTQFSHNRLKLITLGDAETKAEADAALEKIKKDKKDTFRFVAIQSDLGQRIIKHIGINSLHIDSVILYEPGIAYHYKSSALVEITKELSGFLFWASVFRILPITIRDYIYDYVAKNRYKWYGKKDSCLMPSAELQDKFL